MNVRVHMQAIIQKRIGSWGHELFPSPEMSFIIECVRVPTNGYFYCNKNKAQLIEYYGKSESGV